MKKILIFLLTMMGAVVYSQTAVDYDSTSHITSTQTTDYIPIFRDSPSKTLLTMTAEDAFPLVRDSKYIHMRSTTYGLMLGTNSNYDVMLYVNGKSTFTDNLALSTGKRIYLGSGCYIYESANQVYFYSPTTGLKSLTQLSAADDYPVNMTGTPTDGQVAIWSGSDSTIIGSDNLTIDTVIVDKLAINQTGNDWVISALNGYLLFTGSQSNADFNLQSSLTGVYTRASSSVFHFTPQSASLFTGGAEFTATEGDAYYNTAEDNLMIYNGTSWIESGTGNLTIATNQLAYGTATNTIGGSANLLADGDSIYLKNQDNGLYQWLGLSPTGGVFADSISDAGFMLAMPIPAVDEYFKDVKIVNGQNETAWWHMDRKTKEITKTYGIKAIDRNTDIIQALQAGIELNARWNLVANNEIKELKERVEALETDLRKRAASERVRNILRKKK